LGLRKYVESKGHQLIVTSDKDGSGCEMEKHLADAIVVISQPFYPFYLTSERMKMAPKLKLALTAGIGSDHVDLSAAMQNKIDVLEVTYCNSLSVSEHVVMQILALVRNYMPSYKVLRKIVRQFDISNNFNLVDCFRWWLEYC
jgi:formate dehydrogenase